MKAFTAILVLVTSSACAAPHAPASPPVDAQFVFDLLRGVEGDWSGEVVEGPRMNDGAESEHVEQEGETRPVEGRYHVIAGGSVVEATLFKGTQRETVMMFHLDDGKLVLTQYGEAGNSARLVADWSGPAYSEPPSPAHVEVRLGDGSVKESDVDVSAPNATGEPDGVGIRFSLVPAKEHARSNDEYLHDVVVLILKDGTETVWRFYRDGAPTRDVFVELTQKDSPRTAANRR